MISTLMIISLLGGIVAGAGGATVGGAKIGDFVRSRIAKKSTKLLFDEYNSLLERVKNEVVTINSLLEDFGEMETDFSEWVGFWKKLVFGSIQAALGVGWNVVKTIIQDSLTIASYVDDAARIGASTGTTVFRTLGNVGRGFHIAGGVVGIVFMPIDIYTLVSSSIDEHNRNPHKVSEEIRQRAKELAKKCPTKDEIDKMIDETLDKTCPCL